MLHIYTGEGKGKTTAACGLCVRSAGSGKKILFVQFLKNGSSCEIALLKNLGIDVLFSYPTDKFLCSMDSAEKENIRLCCRKLFSNAKEISDRYDVIVLDEIFAVLSESFITCDELLEFVSRSLPREIVLTGRNAPDELISVADYVSEIKCIKHPMEKGTPARKGIEY